MTKPIITWQPVLTDHQSFTFSALAKIVGHEVEANVTHLEHPNRISQGWTMATTEEIDLQVHSGPFKLLSLLRQLYKRRNGIHIFCSPWENMPIIICIVVCAVFGYNYYLISEPYNTSETPYFGAKPTWGSRMKQRLRPTIYRLYGLIICRNVQGVFAISDLAVDQYNQIGVDPQRIIPFGYYIPSKIPATQMKPLHENTRQMRAAFIGSINARKGIDTLVESFRLLESRDSKITVDVYGSGDLSLLNGATENLTYSGKIPFGETQRVLTDYDVMVLLSKHDGWAVVVNEALLVGCPVVCTESVGASCVIREYGAGIIVPVSDPIRAADALERIASDSTEFQRLRAGAIKAAQAITPERAAETILRVIQPV